MPIFGTIGASFSLWQSQFGDTSVMMFIWKLGLSFTTAKVYSAIFLFKISLEWLFPAFIASKLHTPIHLPQPTHFSWLICTFPFLS